MYIRSLLSLTDQELEDVMGAVEIWCRAAGYPVDSEIGREALNLAARRRSAQALSQAQLVRLLANEMGEKP